MNNHEKFLKDKRFRFPLATENQIKEMFQNFYKEASLEQAQQFAKLVMTSNVQEQSDSTKKDSEPLESKFSMAQLQGFLLDHKPSPQDALGHIHDWVQQQQ